MYKQTFVLLTPYQGFCGTFKINILLHSGTEYGLTFSAQLVLLTFTLQLLYMFNKFFRGLFWLPPSFPFTFQLRHQLLQAQIDTRMHSSRMRTGRSLTVCRSLLPGGGAGVCFQGDVSAPRGCLLRGVCSGGVSAPGGGVGRGGGIPACTEADPPPVNRVRHE